MTLRCLDQKKLFVSTNRHNSARTELNLHVVIADVLLCFCCYGIRWCWQNPIMIVPWTATQLPFGVIKKVGTFEPIWLVFLFLVSRCSGKQQATPLPTCVNSSLQSTRRWCESNTVMQVVLWLAKKTWVCLYLNMKSVEMTFVYHIYSSAEWCLLVSGGMPPHTTWSVASCHSYSKCWEPLMWNFSLILYW
jgi:hypothetical protein